MQKDSRAQVRKSGRDLPAVLGRGRKKRRRERPPWKAAVAVGCARSELGCRLPARAAAVQIISGLLIVLALWSAVNWIYQVIRKPSELFFPVSGTLFKTPSETWDSPPTLRYSAALDQGDYPELLRTRTTGGAGNPWREPIGGGPGDAAVSRSIGRHRVRSACIK